MSSISFRHQPFEIRTGKYLKRTFRRYTSHVVEQLGGLFVGRRHSKNGRPDNCVWRHTNTLKITF